MKGIRQLTAKFQCRAQHLIASCSKNVPCRIYVAVSSKNFPQLHFNNYSELGIGIVQIHHLNTKESSVCQFPKKSLNSFIGFARISYKLCRNFTILSSFLQDERVHFHKFFSAVEFIFRNFSPVTLYLYQKFRNTYL